MKKAVMVFIIFVFSIGFFTTFAMPKSSPRITKEELKAMMDKPDVVIIDVRYGKDWTKSDIKIKSAVRENPTDVKSWVDKYEKDTTLVLYCA
jgi:rhodanese-related sulfurtransferase